MQLNPDDLGLLRWLWENVWVPIVIGVGYLVRKVISGYDRDLAEVRALAAAAATKAELVSADERLGRSLHSIRGDMHEALGALHSKIDVNERERSRRHDDLMRAILHQSRRDD